MADQKLLASLQAKYVMLPPCSRFLKYVENLSEEIGRIKSEEEDDMGESRYSRSKEKNMRAAKYKIAEWFLNISTILREHERFLLSFQSAQLALCYAEADVIEIKTEVSSGCLPFRSWNLFSRDSFNMSSKTHVQTLRLAQSAYENCGLALHSLSIQTSKDMNILHRFGNDALRRAKQCTVLLWNADPSETKNTNETNMSSEAELDAGTADLRHKKKNMTDRISKLYRAKAQLRDVVTDLTFEKITNWTEFDIFEVAAAVDRGVLFPTLFEVLYDTNGFNVIRALNVSRSVCLFFFSRLVFSTTQY